MSDELEPRIEEEELNLKPNKRYHLSPNLITKIGVSMARGLTEEQACRVHAVPYNTYRHALKTKPEYVDLIEQAKAYFLEEATQRIYSGEKSWQGAAWILERRHRGQFQRTETVITTGAKGGIDESVINALSDVQKQLANS